MTEQARKVMSRASLDAMFQAAKDQMPDEVRKAAILAEVRRIHYDASLAKGFTREEALTLCMKTKLD